MSFEAALTLLVCLVGVALLAWVIRNEYRRTKSTDDGITWSQAGVSVDSRAQTITHFGFTFPAAKVTRVTIGRSRNRGIGTFPSALILTDQPGAQDIRIPFTFRGSAETFAWGLREALTRAGNTNPEATNKPFKLGKE